MSGVSLSTDKECRSLGFVNNPPRGYFRTVKTCIPKAKNFNIEGNLCVGGIVQTDALVPKTLDASPPTIRVEGDLCIDGALKTTGDICFEGTVQTDVIAPKSTDTSPETPVTIDGGLCVEGTVQTDVIAPKSTDTSPETPVTIDGSLCVEGTVQTNVIAPKSLDASPPKVRVEGGLCVEGELQTTGDICFEGTVRTNVIAPKTPDTSPPTPVTIDGGLCVEGRLQTNVIAPKSLDASPPTVRVDGDLCVDGALKTTGDICFEGTVRTDFIAAKNAACVSVEDTLKVDGDVCVENALVTDCIRAKIGESSGTVTVKDADLCVNNGTVQTDFIAPKTTDGSPETPVTIDGALCVNSTINAKSDVCVDGNVKLTSGDICVTNGTVQTDAIEAKTPGSPVCIGATGSPANSELRVDVIAAKTPGSPVCIGATGSPANSELRVDVIAAKTEGSPETPVTIDGVLCVNSTVNAKSDLCVVGDIKSTGGDICVTNGTVRTDFIAPKTTEGSPATPVTIDGELCVNGGVQTDIISSKSTEGSPASPVPVTIDGELCVDGTLRVAQTISTKVAGTNLVLEGNGSGIVVVNDDLCVMAGSTVQTNTIEAKTAGFPVCIDATGSPANSELRVDVIAPKTESSPPTPVTINGDVCVNGNIKATTGLCESGCLAENTYEPTLAITQPLESPPEPIALQNASFHKCNNIVTVSVRFAITDAQVTAGSIDYNVLVDLPFSFPGTPSMSFDIAGNVTVHHLSDNTFAAGVVTADVSEASKALVRFSVTAASNIVVHATFHYCLTLLT